MTIVIAHRTCPLHEAENSLAGIERSGELKANGVEIDVRITRDFEPVLVHDRTLLRIAGWPLPTRYFSFERLRRFKRRDNGLRIPTFAESLEALPEGVLIAIDLKDPRAAEVTIEEIKRQGAEDRVLLWAQSMKAVKYFAKALPNVERALLRDTRAGKPTRQFLEDAKRCNADAVSAHWDRITPKFVTTAHNRGLKVYAMAQNAESQAEKIAMGLNGVVTNWPEEALASINGQPESS
jgi:glycerophosphoryl diester phosphodiesterase